MITNIIQDYAYLNLLFSFCKVLCLYVLHVQQWCTLMFKHNLCIWICLKTENSSQVYLMRWLILVTCVLLVGIITYLICGLWIIFIFYSFNIFIHLSGKCIMFSYAVFLHFLTHLMTSSHLVFLYLLPPFPSPFRNEAVWLVCENNCCLYSALQQQISDVCGDVNCFHELLCRHVAVQVHNCFIPHIIYEYCICQQNVRSIW
jgi:hypothetical protein